MQPRAELFGHVLPEPELFVPERPAWQDQGACVGEDPGLFYPAPWEAQKLAAARSICERCPVTEECLAYALDNHEDYGVWAGTTQRDRKRIHKRMRQNSEHGTRSRYVLGCRCDDCKAANNAYVRSRRVQR